MLLFGGGLNIVRAFRETKMTKTNWSVQGYLKPEDTETKLIMDGLTQEQAIALADRLKGIFGVDCFHAEKI